MDIEALCKGNQHRPTIAEGAYKAGSAHYLKLEYNTGDSKWLSPAVYIMPTKKEEK